MFCDYFSEKLLLLQDRNKNIESYLNFNFLQIIVLNQIIYFSISQKRIILLDFS